MSFSHKAGSSGTAASSSTKNASHTVHEWKIAAMLVACGMLVASLMSAVLLALGVHLEHEDLTPDPPSTAEKSRQDLAIHATRIANSASLSSTHESLEKSARTWVHELGGVWIPWPQGAPEGYSNPTVDTSQYSSLAELDAALWDFYGEALRFHPSSSTSDQSARASDQSDQDTSTTTVQSQSFTTSRIAFDAVQYAMAIDTELGKETQCGSFDPAALAPAFSSHPDSLGSLDTARQWLEYSYARSDPSLNAAYEQSIHTLDSAINAALEAGAPDTRPLIAAPPSDQQNAYIQIKQALSDLAAANAGQNDRIAAIESFACTALLQVPQK